MKLHIQQLIDYQKCPTLYKFRWVDGIDTKYTEQRQMPNKWHMHEDFDRALHQVAYGFFHEVADGRIPNEYYMKKRWGYAWSKGRSKEDILFDTGSWRNEHRKLERRGLNALLRLHSHFKNNPGTPILIGKEYLIQIGKHTLSGVIDLVREVNDEEGKPIIEIVDFKSDDRPTILHVKGDMGVTAASLAFRKLFNYKENRITYHGIISGKEQYTVRDDKDSQLLEGAVNNIVKGIENNIFYPVLNDRCFECPFQKHCEKKEWFS